MAKREEMFLKIATDLGRTRAYDEAESAKTATESTAKTTAKSSAPMTSAAGICESTKQ